MLKQNRTTSELRQVIIDSNPEDYNLLKLAEEAIELSEVLVKMVTKPNKRDERIPHLIEELGDVEFRMAILLQQYQLAFKVKERHIEKLNKLVSYADEKKYETY